MHGPIWNAFANVMLRKHIVNLNIACLLWIWLWLASCILLANEPAAPSEPDAKKPALKGQYKKIHRHKIKLLVDGKTNQFLRQLQKIFDLDPEDPETNFCLALAQAQLGDQEKAVDYVKASIRQGMDIRRYFAGPRQLTDPLVKSHPFQDLTSQNIKLVHGPMLGNVTSNRVDVWVRTANASEVSIRTFGKEFLGSTSARNDFTTVIRLHDLQPDSKYEYSIDVDGEEIDLPFRTEFQTLPPSFEGLIFKVAFGGGSGFTPYQERMWDVIGSHEPDVLLLLGDNIYVDLPESPEVQRYCYYRRQSRLEFRRLIARTPVYSVWDDHDFGTNDCHGGPDIEFPAWKRRVYQVFRENWVNPSYGGNHQNPGCWYSTRLGPIELFFLDTRYYRTPGRHMLGKFQLDWFLAKLESSTARFKVICSSVPMARGTKPGSKDTWDGYADERERIFSWIDQKDISGIFVLAADRHRSDAWKIERPNGYDTYEFMSSRLTNVHVHKMMKNSLLSYNQKCSFGLVSFDFRAMDPTVTYDVYNIENELIFSFTTSLGQLTKTHPN